MKCFNYCNGLCFLPISHFKSHVRTNQSQFTCLHETYIEYIEIKVKNKSPLIFPSLNKQVLRDQCLFFRVSLI